MTGKGNDNVLASQLIQISYSGQGQSQFLLGPGNDRLSIVFRGYTSSNPLTMEASLQIFENSLLDTGSGNDKVIVKLQSSKPSSYRPEAIYLRGGHIAMGEGKDTLTGYNRSGPAIGLSGEATISMGKGHDKLDVITGGIALSGESTVDMGPGNDRVFIDLESSSFLNTNRSSFMGGTGTDSIFLNEGRYQIIRDPLNPSILSIKKQRSNSQYTQDFYFHGFERIGNALTGKASALKEGDLYIVNDELFTPTSEGDLAPF